MSNTKTNTNLHWYILMSIAVAICVGIFTNKDTNLFGFEPYYFYNFIGNLFLNGLRMLSIPLILTSIISGMSNIGSDSNIGKLGSRTLVYYLITSTIAIIIGLVFINLVGPGYDPGLSALHSLESQQQLQEIFSKTEGDSHYYIANIFYQLLPSNIFNAAANGQMLGLIFFSLLFGYFILHVNEKQKKILVDFWGASFEAIMLFTIWFLKFTPIGVFGLVAKAVVETGFDSFWPLIKFFVTVVAALGFHTFIILSLLLIFVGRVSPLKHIKAVLPALLTSFSTSSSSATLPVTIECIEKNANVSNKVSSFVLPLGATVNMNGTALYEGMAAIFIAQTFGVSLGFEKQLLVLIIALLTSIGVAGIPSASIVAISIILTSIGIPLEAIGIIMVTDRILDMLRTSVNVYSDTCGAVIIGKSMGEKDILNP